MKPILFVTNHAPPFRIPAFKALHERENVVFALIGGHVRHGGGGTQTALPFPAELESRALQGSIGPVQQPSLAEGVAETIARFKRHSAG